MSRFMYRLVGISARDPQRVPFSGWKKCAGLRRAPLPGFLQGSQSEEAYTVNKDE